MLNNGNQSCTFNSYKDLTKLPYNVIMTLINEDNDSSKAFWKLLKYQTVDALEEAELSLAEKKALLYQGNGLSQDCSVFLQPLVGDAVDDCSNVQVRMYRYMTTPSDLYTSRISFQFDILCNDRLSLVYDEDGLLCERTDLIEYYLLNMLNGRDIGVGSSFFEFSRQRDNNCRSTLAINNAKNIYGRSLIMSVLLVGTDREMECC